MRVVDLIRRKRDGHELSREEISSIVAGYTKGDIPDYQIASLLMAIVWRRMSGPELAALTEAMLHSGDVLSFPELAGKKVDKHSTGGVGDKTSLILAPIVASAGLYVPMISGRGLGHTGGTLDKLESIPGFNVNLSLPDFRRVLKECGCGLIGQTGEIAPADKKLYALRDVTGTVESPFLICASIMSKKLAEGIDALVLDVKTGSGAFMKKKEDAIFLAELMVDTGARMGKKMVALITDMDQPLGNMVGNALEIEECIDVLNGKGPEDLRELSLQLSAWMFYLGERTKTVEEGYNLAAVSIATGCAREKFREIIKLQGGDPSVIDNPKRLPQAQHKVNFTATQAGFVASMDCERIGTASVVLGGGREKKEDAVDPAVGLFLHKKVGDEVAQGDALCTVYYNSDQRLEEALALLRSGYHLAPVAPETPRILIHQIIQRTA
jgi:pyrimidine-nucleoside phosphorylase/thymidine phosphorylase